MNRDKAETNILRAGEFFIHMRVGVAGRVAGRSLIY